MQCPPGKNIKQDYEYVSEYCHPHAVFSLTITIAEWSCESNTNQNQDKEIRDKFETFFNFPLNILLQSLRGIDESLKTINNLVQDEFLKTA
jgi:hypothetical protein